MRLTISPDDHCVIVDGDVLSGLALPESSNVHAIQWYGDHGVIERKTGPAEHFTDFAVVQPYLDAWQVERDRLDAPLPPPPAPSLPDAVAAAEAAIDREAGAARVRFISTGAGQDATYMVKGLQAEAFRAAGYAGEVPPYIAAEAAATGQSEKAAADSILTVRDAWNNLIGPAIEALRIGGKKRVREMPDVAGVLEAQAETVAALREVRP